MQQCDALGLVPVVGAHARESAGYLAGSDAQRRADLHAAITDPAIDAIWNLRGGYGTMRLLAALDLATLEQRPKAYIGFSDHTAVHLALYRRAVVSFHGPHAGAETTEMTEQSMRHVLFNPEPAGVMDMPASHEAFTLVSGVAEGPLVGGNLSLLAAMAGTPAALNARGAVLFVEEIGEPPYRIDRLWTQLVLSGALEGVAGLAFGQFSDCGDDVAPLLAGFAETLGVPTLAGLPFGHEPDNWTLPIGVRARLDADAGTLALLEPAVTP